MPVDGPADRGASAPPDDEDRQLLARSVDGDHAAFGELVRRHRDRLWAVALRTLGDPEQAADALQDGLLRAFRAAASYRGEARVTTWLHRIVVNACLDLARREASRRTVPLPPEDQAPRSARDPLVERETAGDVATALAALPLEQRTALVLVDVQGYRVEEVARILDVPVGTVKSRCARGRARLAVSLAHLRPSPPAGNRPVAGRVPSQGLSEPEPTGQPEPEGGGRA